MSSPLNGVAAEEACFDKLFVVLHYLLSGGVITSSSCCTASNTSSYASGRSGSGILTTPSTTSLGGPRHSGNLPLPTCDSVHTTTRLRPGKLQPLPNSVPQWRKETPATSLARRLTRAGANRSRGSRTALAVEVKLSLVRGCFFRSKEVHRRRVRYPVVHRALDKATVWRLLTVMP